MYIIKENKYEANISEIKLRHYTCTIFTLFEIILKKAVITWLLLPNSTDTQKKMILTIVTRNNILKPKRKCFYR